MTEEISPEQQKALDDVLAARARTIIDDMAAAKIAAAKHDATLQDLASGKPPEDLSAGPSPETVKSLAALEGAARRQIFTGEAATLPLEAVVAAIAVKERDDEEEQPYDWAELTSFCPSSTAVMAGCVAYGAAAQFVQFFGEAGLDPLKFDAFCSAPDDARFAMVEYIMQRQPTAEALFIKCMEWGGGRKHEGVDTLAPYQRAGLELLVRLVPAVVETIEAMNAEISCRAPPPEPPPGRPIPLDETSLEEVPGFGERMER